MNGPKTEEADVVRPVCALVVAGGSGLRARTSDRDTAKQFEDLAGLPVFAHALRTLAAHPRVECLICVLPADQINNSEVRDAAHRAAGASVNLIFTVGGASRRASVAAGLVCVSGSYRTVLIHDAARPFLTAPLIDTVLAGLSRAEGAVPALPVSDTLKRSNDGLIVSGPDRSDLLTVQTPQAFRTDAISGAHRKLEAALEQGTVAEAAFTDDASVLEWAGGACVAVAGDPDNIKITNPADWARVTRAIAYQQEGLDMAPSIGHANAHIQRETRVGVGYDTHRLVPGDGVWLCGHFIAHTHKLDGHSDADVGLHALTDALLGAIGAGDIGTHFPPSDPQWKGAASHQFLTHAGKLVGERGGRIVNLDVVIIAEEPKVGPHRPAMLTAVSQALGIEQSRVSIKATTNERMGFVGRSEGIAAFATASVELPNDP
ncbi:MAG: 2-C-methyl-D-erythritol 2,4-cyclodiphosphate synthase [Pseudomonadota bacterium]